MPWKDILESLLLAGKRLALPHPPELIAHLVRLHLKTDSCEITRHLKEICVRSHVILQLGYDLIDAGHPAFMQKTNAGKVIQKSAQQIKEEYRKLVEQRYPTPADPALAERGVPPPEVLAVAEDSRKASKQTSPMHDKNATPQEGAVDPSEVFDSVQPQAVLLQRTVDAGSNTAEKTEAALSRYSELRVQTGSKLMPQWKPEYLSYVFCHEIPRVTGGPELSREDRLRHLDAPLVDMFQYTTGLPRRIERQLRSSWVLVPGLYNLYFRNQIRESSGIAYRMSLEAGHTLEAHGRDLCAAGAELYKLLADGKYRTSAGKLRKISGDIAKLRYADGVSPKAKTLEANMRHKMCSSMRMLV